MIDTHVHFFPDKIADRAVVKLAAAAGKTPATNGTASDTVAKMDEWGVDECWLMSIATNEKQMQSVNDFALSVKSERIYPFASVYPLSPLALGELERVYSLGFRGIKLHPEYQQFEVSDKRVYPVYEFIKSHNMMLTFHAGRDVAYPDTYYASPKSIKKVLDDFKGIKVIAAHLGGWEVWSEVLEYEAGKDVYFDTAYLDGMIDENVIKQILKKHPIERILLGSDCPWSTPLKEIGLLSKYIGDSQMQLVCHANAEALKNSVERG